MIILKDCLEVIIQLSLKTPVYLDEINNNGIRPCGLILGENLMNKRIIRTVLIIGLVSLSLASCYVMPAAGRVRSQSEDIDQGGAESVRVEILMGAGKLEIKGGADKLLEGDFTYSYREYAPEIDYRVRGNGVGLLEVKQEEKPGIRINNNYRNEWELRFNQDVPLDLDVILGAGEGDLDLSQLNLGSFSLQMGAGQANVDLTGAYPGDLQVNIQGGVGELTVVLPDDTNIEASVQGGLGEINTSGLDREGNRYVSKYTGSGPIINLNIEAGIGELNLFVQ